MLRIVEYDKKIDIHQLEAIKNKILDSNFCFDFVCRNFINKNKKNLSGKIIIQPMIDRFQYYILIEEDGKTKCKLHLYNGRPGVYFSEFFFHGKWKGENELIIKGKEKEVEIHVLANECKVDFVNLTRYSQPPYFTLMRADISEQEREKARKNWEHSLLPAVAAVVRQAHN